MRKLIVQQWVTVDNIAAKRMGLIDSVDTMILGASTYAQAKDDWPNADDQGGTARSSTTSPIPPWTRRRRGPAALRDQDVIGEEDVR